MAKETQSVGLSMTMLCMTLCFIYVVFFGVHGENLQNELDALENQEWVYALSANVAPSEPIELPQQADPLPQEESVPDIQELPSSTTKPIAQAPQSIAWRNFYSVQELFRTEQVNTSDVYDLAWTWKWDGELKSLGVVGLLWYQKYTLKNLDNTHFILLESLPVDFRASILAKWWNVVEITNENDIKQLQLFGDSVRYINLPSYEWIKVLQLVFIDDTIWYMQVDHEIYEQRKQQFIETFDPWFDW